MQKKTLSTYKITHWNGTQEFLNAASMLEALENLDTPDEESAVIAASRTQTGIPSLFPDEPTEVNVKVYTDPTLQATGCEATPEAASVHAGDELTLEAFPARNYTFTGWKVDGAIVSTEPKYVFTVPEPAIKGDLLNILAEFKESDVSYTVAVSPSEATGSGCAAGPDSTVAANAETELYAVDSDTYKFDGWYRNGEALGVTPVLKTTVAPLAEDEESCIFEAKFSLRA